MLSKKTSLLAIVLLSTVLIGVTTAPPATTTAISAQSIPPLTGFTQLPNGVWYKVEDLQIPNPLPNATGTSINDHIFVYKDLFHNVMYGVRETTDWSLSAAGTAYIHRVWLVSDPDGSLNGSPRRLTGDEVSTVTTGIVVNGSYATTRLRTFNWYNVTGTLASPVFTPLNQTQLTILNETLKVARMLAGTVLHDLNAVAYLSWAIDYLMVNDTASVNYGANYAYFTWWIDQDFFPKFLKTSTVTDIDIMQIRHRLLGFVAFNDTNSNNIMDLIYRKVTTNTAVYRGVTTSEAMYVFQADSVHSVAGTIPAYNASTGYVDWSWTMTGVNGAMISTRSDLASFATEIDQVGFGFHFKRSGNDAVIKVDEHIGTFSGVAGVAKYSNLSLAIVYFSYFEMLSIDRYHPEMQTNTGASVDTEGNSTGPVPQVDVGPAGDLSARITIAGDNYVWGGDGQTYTAYSNLVPWFFFSEKFATVGNCSLTGLAFSKLWYFYEACFPKWGGYSITHDPYFATFGYSTTPGGGLPIVLIVAGAGIGVLVAAAVLLMTKRRKAPTIS